jgi:WD40 repeat protein
MIACSEQLAFDPTALDWSPDGKFIAVGDRNGSAKILNAEDLQVLGSVNASNAGKKNAWVEDIKFSPDGTTIAYGTHGGVSKLELAKVA